MTRSRTPLGIGASLGTRFMASETTFRIVKAIVNAMAKRTLVISRHIVPSDAINTAKLYRPGAAWAGSEYCESDNAISYDLVNSSNLRPNGCKLGFASLTGV